VACAALAVSHPISSQDTGFRNRLDMDLSHSSRISFNGLRQSDDRFAVTLDHTVSPLFLSGQ